MAGKGNHAKGHGPKPLNAGFKAPHPEGGKPKDRDFPRGLRAPVEFSEELWANIIEQISCGCTLDALGDTEGYPAKETITRWSKSSPERRAQYETAMRERCGPLVERALSEAMNSKYQPPEMLPSSRLIVDTCLRVAGILEPKYSPRNQPTETEISLKQREIRVTVRNYMQESIEETQEHVELIQ